RREVLQAQAVACGLPLLEAGIPAECDNDTYEAAMAGALAEAERRWPGLRTAAFGDLLLEDIRAWRQAQCARVGWDILTPLFGADTASPSDAKCSPGTCAPRCAAWTRSNWMPVSPAATSTPRCSTTCRQASIRAARTANSTPASRPARCSPHR